ncbi:hypothetical protein ACU686_08390 [Yinghuangia aomiensis]
MHHEIDLADVPRLTRDDGLCAWAAQDGARAWADGTAVAVAAPGLWRCATASWCTASATPSVPLVRAVFDEIGATYRPLGAPELVRALGDGIDGLAVLGESSHGWNAAPARRPPRPARDARTPSGWSPPTTRTSRRYIDDVFPDSYARPGIPGVLRWAGIRGADGAARRGRRGSVVGARDGLPQRRRRGPHRSAGRGSAAVSAGSSSTRSWPSGAASA